MDRYARNKLVEGIGEEGQKRLSSGRVLIVGCGALGSLAAMYLAGAGVGHITIADFDTVDLSNLQRQLFFEEAQAGMKKAILLKERMSSLNSEISVEVVDRLVTVSLAETLFPQFDIVVDGSDNPDTKYTTDAVSRLTGIPCCIGGVSGWQLQVMTLTPESPMRYYELFSPSENNGGVLPCSVNGVIGPVAGMAASAMASEVIKFLTGCGTLLSDRFLNIDVRDWAGSIIRFS